MYDRHLALMCVACSDVTGEEIVGAARYVINADGKSCYFARTALSSAPDTTPAAIRCINR